MIRLGRAVLLLLLALLVSANPVAASTPLEARIQTATGIVRPVDAALQARAAIRAVEIQTTFGHCCLAPNEAEIIVRIGGYADPLQLVAVWLGSPDHAAILLDPYWHTIGCAVAVSGTRTYGVCLFRGDSAFDTPALPGTVPNTAMRAR